MYVLIVIMLVIMLSISRTMIIVITAIIVIHMISIMFIINGHPRPLRRSHHTQHNQLNRNPQPQLGSAVPIPSVAAGTSWMVQVSCVLASYCFRLGGVSFRSDRFSSV